MTRRLTPAQHARWLVRLLKETGITEFDFGEADYRIAGEVLVRLWRLHQRGAAIPSIVRVTVDGLAGPRDRWAGGTQLALHSVFPEGPAELQVGPDILTLLEPGDTLDMILTHELGHHAHFLAVGRDRYLALCQRAFTPREQRVFDAAMHPDQADFRWWLRMFDNTDPVEFVAEAFRVLSDGYAVPNTLRRLYTTLGGPAPIRRAEGQ